MAGVVHSRGNPDGPTLDRRELEFVHLRVQRATDGTMDDTPACCNGAFNLRWTRFPARVSCPHCIKILGKPNG